MDENIAEGVDKSVGRLGGKVFRARRFGRLVRTNVKILQRLKEILAEKSAFFLENFFSFVTFIDFSM